MSMTSNKPVRPPRETALAAAPPPAWSFRVPRRVASRSPPQVAGLRGAAQKTLVAFLAALLAWGTGYSLAYIIDQQEITSSRDAVAAVVENIVKVESSGNANAKNPRSTATGAAQFIEATWMELIRQHRSDLLLSRSPQEVLDMRRDPLLARELTARFIERNAKVLRRSGHPVTPGTLYLSHFAGGAGAVAILSAQEKADAAETLALADSTGKMSREKLVKANPFLEGVTAGGLKRWAERKMQKAGTRTAAQATRSL